MTYLLSIDGGTGSVRAALTDVSGHMVAVVSRDWVHGAEPGVPASMAFDTANNFELITDAISELLARTQVAGREVVAISTTSMREGIVLLDHAGNEIWACANVDARAGDIVRELETDASIESQVYQLSGQTFALAAQPRLLWLARNRPEIYARAATMLMLSEWISYRLCGERFMEPSNGSTSGMLALASRAPDATLATCCGLRDDLMPRVVEPGTAVGTLLPAVAAQLGLSPATRVVAGGGDAQVAALGLGLTKPGDTLIVAGTFWQQVVNIANPITDPAMRVRINAAAIADMWQAEAIVFHAGTAIRWFRDTFAQPEQLLAQQTGRNVLDVLTAAAAAIPIGSDGIIPIFSDQMNYRHWVHAAPSFLNLGLAGGQRTRHAMFRSLLENAAIVAAANLQLVTNFAPSGCEEVVFAGGSAKSPMWCQLVADVLGRPLRIPAACEATAQGAAACAAAGAGLFSSPLEAASAFATWDRVVGPNMVNHLAYQEVAARWRAAYPPQLALATSGITHPLWQAPGT